MENGLENKNNLWSRVIKAGLWALTGFGMSQVIRLANNLIMTRLLVPEMFGIMALAQVFLFMMTLISDIGIKPSIIRSRRGDDPQFINTAWTIQIIRGTIVTVLVLLVALIIKVANEFGLFSENSAYTAPELPMIIAVMSLTSLINGFSSMNIIIANRKMLLGRLTIIQIFSQIAGIFIMIAWALLIERSVWALVSGAVLSSLIMTIMSHTSFPGAKSRIEWKSDVFWEIFHYGKWILVSSLISAFLAQGDRLILGNLVSGEILGIYAIAYFLASAVNQAIFKLNFTVFFPLFSEINRDNEKEIASIYYKVRRVSDGISMSLAGFLFVSGGAIVNLLFDQRYHDAGWMLSVLSFSLIFTGTSISDALYFSVDKPKYPSIKAVINTVILLGGLPFIFNVGGFEWAVWLLALYLIGSLPLDFYLKNKLGVLNILKEFYMLPIMLVGGAAGYIFNKLVSLIV
ncbi:MAG: oligosaccharide flippase family protein [Emcibacteraceae bacterium]